MNVIISYQIILKILHTYFFMYVKTFIFGYGN